MIPRGPLYSRIREDLLAAFPTNRLVTARDRTEPFSDWLLNALGSYSVSSISNSAINFTASPIDLAASVALEIEFLTNNCFEHLVEIIYLGQDTRERSDAWNVVTIYYFGFFAASMFLRLVGQPLLFADKTRIDTLKGMASTGSSNMGAGAYSVLKTGDISSSVSEFAMRQSSLKIHEGTWNRFFLYIQNLLSDSSLLTSGQEVLFYRSISQHILDSIYGAGWPSNLRNRANYKPGQAYRSVEKSDSTKSRRLVLEWRGFDSNRLVNSLSYSATACVPAQKDPISNHVKLMFNISQSLFLLTRELYSELFARRILDPAWEHRRRNYKQRLALPGDLSPLLPTYSL
jgi:hypothetical protein